MNWKTYTFQALRRLFLLALLGTIVWFGVLPLVHWLMFYPHPILEALREHFIKNLPEYATFLAALSIAAVCTMPKKMPFVSADSQLQELWTWFRDSLQTAVPTARASSHPPNPIPPADPAQPQK